MALTAPAEVDHVVADHPAAATDGIDRSICSSPRRLRIE
jgi:hypothetical protein